MKAVQIKRVMNLLELDASDVKLLAKIQNLGDLVEGMIESYIGEDVVPKSLEWLVEEMVIKRYRKLGAEHLSAESIDSLSVTYAENNILADYLFYLDNYMEKVEKNSNVGSKKMWML